MSVGVVGDLRCSALVRGRDAGRRASRVSRSRHRHGHGHMVMIALRLLVVVVAVDPRRGPPASNKCYYR